MKRLELLDKLKALQKEAREGDTEATHRDADCLILEYIDDAEIKEAFDNIYKWYA